MPYKEKIALFAGVSWKNRQPLLDEEAKKFSNRWMYFDYGSNSPEITARNCSGST